MVDELKRAFADQVHGGHTKRVTGSAGGATTLVAYEQNVQVTQPASGTHTITLPPVADCKGRIYMLTAPGSGSGTVTVQSGDDDYPVMPDQVLDVANSYLMLMSNGVRFLILTADDVQGTNTVITASAGGATSLSVDQQNVGVTKFSSGTHTITLPAVATCVGRIYTITALGTGAGTVTVDTQDDDVPVLVDHVLSAQNSYVVLVSDGVRFFLVDSGGDTAIKAIVCTDGGATQLLLEEQYVTCTAPDGTTHTITLPAVATCMGRIYSIFCTSNDTGTVTIASDGLSDVVLTTTSDNLIVLSDGVRFHVLLEVST